MNGSVVAIFIAPAKGAPMQAVSEVRASREYGLEGDRYGRGQGSWSTPGTTHRQVTIIAEEAIAEANAALWNAVERIVQPKQTRRNILVRGIDPNALVEKKFRIGQAHFRGKKLATPCTRPAVLAGWRKEESETFPIAFENRGGLCAEVVTDGEVRIGDEVITEIEP